MAWYVSNEFDYNDNGRKIHKQEWTDDATGETWSAFTDVGTWDAPDTQVSSGDGGSTWSQQGPYAQPSTVANQQNQQQTGGAGPMPNQGPAQDYGAQAWQANQGASQGVPAKPSGSVYTGSNSMDVTAGKFRYPLNDPGFAVQNALRSMGVSPMSMNPYTQSLMQTAPALMSAFVSNAGSGYSPGADIGNAFGGWLKNVIGGGSVDSVLQNAAQSFPGMIDAVRGFNQQFASNPDLGEMMNPLMATLASMVSQNGGQGGIQLLQALMGGLLPRAVAGPYNQYLGAAGSAARDRLLQESNFTSPTDIFSYLFK